MDKIVPFNKGIHRQPSLGEDGELSELVNLIPRNGELVNVRGMEPYVSGLGEGEVFLGIHKVAVGDVLVFSKDDTLLFYTEAEGRLTRFTDPVVLLSPARSIEVVGNVLGVITDKEDLFFLYKDGTYESLGTGFPELPITFDIAATTRTIGTMTLVNPTMYTTNANEGYYCAYEVTGDVTLPDGGVLPDGALNNGYLYFGFKFKTETIDEIEAKINNANLTSQYFVYPFFVRCAYKSKLDDSYVHVTPPVLMMCTSGSCIYVEMNTSGVKAYYQSNPTNLNGAETSSSSGAMYNIRAIVHSLRYRINKKIEFDSWDDIISGVDIFVSKQMPTSKEDIPISNIGRGELASSRRTFYVGSKKGNDSCKRTKYSVVEIAGDNIAYWEPNSDYAEFKPENYTDYFLFKSISLSDLKKVTVGVFNSIDDGSMDTTSPVKNLYIEDRSVKKSRNLVGYNNRMVRVGSVKEYFNGFDVQTALPALTWYDDDSKRYSEECYYYVTMVKEGVAVVVGGEVNKGFVYSLVHNGIYYFYYPDSDATHVTFRVMKDGEYKFYRIGLTQNKNAGYSYAFSNGNSILLQFSADEVKEPSVSNNRTGDRSMLYFTDADNPIDNDEVNEVRVSFGDILNVASSAKALSQGQFGQFPLYAFCSDGIWALGIADDGTFNSNQPISRDVCNNPDSVTQIDGAVVFTTDQGLMMIQGSEVVCLSDGMVGHNIDENVYFPNGFFNYGDNHNFTKLVIPETRDFREILKTCKIAYDYVNKMLRIFPKENTGKYYVFSLDTREFATVVPLEKNSTNAIVNILDVKSVVAGYPSSIVQMGEKLYKPCESDDNEDPKIGLLLTRPISMNEPFALKKLQDMKLYYSKFDGTSKCKVVVYVSNDGTNWGVMSSLRKRSYKYYRFAVATRMKDMDALSGMALRYELERTNKLR